MGKKKTKDLKSLSDLSHLLRELSWSLAALAHLCTHIEFAEADLDSKAGPGLGYQIELRHRF